MKTQFSSTLTYDMCRKKLELPKEASSNVILSDWQSEKYKLANILKLSACSTVLNLGWHNGEETSTEDEPFCKESGRLKDPGLSIRSTIYSLSSLKFINSHYCQTLIFDLKVVQMWNDRHDIESISWYWIYLYIYY